MKDEDTPCKNLLAGRRIGIRYNPISGNGQSATTAKHCADYLQARGADVDILQTPKNADPSAEIAAIKDFAALIIAGGDGTLMSYLPALSSTQTPVYMIPSGNESLFAREFSMTADCETILATLLNERIEEHFIGHVGRNSFFSMASIGIDSQAVKNLSEQRTGPAGHLGYILPTLRALLQHRAPRISLWVDGKQLLDDEQGYLIIGNTKQFALGLNFLPEANSSDQLLSGRFFPYRSVLQFFRLCLPLIKGWHQPSAAALFFQGKECRIETSDQAQFPLQADGEYIGKTPQTITKDSDRIRVLIP